MHIDIVHNTKSLLRACHHKQKGPVKYILLVEFCDPVLVLGDNSVPSHFHCWGHQSIFNLQLNKVRIQMNGRIIKVMVI